MKAAQLHETIKKAGPKLFVHHFDLIANPVLPVEAIAARILLTKKYDRAGLLNRLYHARRICKANAAREALRIICDNNALAGEIKSRALKLYRTAAIPAPREFISPSKIPAPPYSSQSAQEPVTTSAADAKSVPPAPCSASATDPRTQERENAGTVSTAVPGTGKPTACTVVAGDGPVL